jgi:hypothetical protein
MIRTNPNHEATKVIDNQDQTERLLRKLTEVLPLSPYSPDRSADLSPKSERGEDGLGSSLSQPLVALAIVTASRQP